MGTGSRAGLLRLGAGVLGLTACGEPSPYDPALQVQDWTPDMLVLRQKVDLETFTRDGRSVVLDPEAGLLLENNLTQRWAWPEHARGFYVRRTNSLGLLEAREIGRKRCPRLLVLGDSHLMTVDVKESFPHVLERKLRTMGHASLQVLNAGVPYTGPRMYLMRLRHLLALEPDGVIVSLFTGNDFLDDLQLKYDPRASPAPKLDERYMDRLLECPRSALTQGLSFAHWVKHWPGTEELAVREVLASLQEIQALCSERGLEFAVVLLPSKTEVDEDLPEERAEALATLELSEEEADANRRCGLATKRALEERGVPCVDLYDEMKTSAESFYWKGDHHLNCAGHAFVAERLVPVIEPWLAK